MTVSEQPHPNPLMNMPMPTTVPRPGPDVILSAPMTRSGPTMNERPHMPSMLRMPIESTTALPRKTQNANPRNAQLRASPTIVADRSGSIGSKSCVLRSLAMLARSAKLMLVVARQRQHSTNSLRTLIPATTGAASGVAMALVDSMGSPLGCWEKLQVTERTRERDLRRHLPEWERLATLPDPTSEA